MRRKSVGFSWVSFFGIGMAMPSFHFFGTLWFNLLVSKINRRLSHVKSPRFQNSIGMPSLPPALFALALVIAISTFFWSIVQSKFFMLKLFLLSSSMPVIQLCISIGELSFFVMLMCWLFFFSDVARHTFGSICLLLFSSFLSFFLGFLRDFNSSISLWKGLLVVWFFPFLLFISSFVFVIII